MGGTARTADVQPLREYVKCEPVFSFVMIVIISTVVLFYSTDAVKRHRRLATDKGGRSERNWRVVDEKTANGVAHQGPSQVTSLDTAPASPQALNLPYACLCAIRPANHSHPLTTVRALMATAYLGHLSSTCCPHQLWSSRL